MQLCLRRVRVAARKLQPGGGIGSCAAVGACWRGEGVRQGDSCSKPASGRQEKHHSVIRNLGRRVVGAVSVYNCGTSPSCASRQGCRFVSLRSKHQILIPVVTAQQIGCSLQLRWVWLPIPGSQGDFQQARHRRPGARSHVAPISWSEGQCYYSAPLIGQVSQLHDSLPDWAETPLLSKSTKYIHTYIQQPDPGRCFSGLGKRPRSRQQRPGLPLDGRQAPRGGDWIQVDRNSLWDHLHITEYLSIAFRHTT